MIQVERLDDCPHIIGLRIPAKAAADSGASRTGIPEDAGPGVKR
jgi:hypothetical protein